jgi:CIC family chloride channel protein
VRIPRGARIHVYVSSEAPPPLRSRLFLGGLAGYVPPGTAGEGGAPPTAIGRPWVLPLVTAAGGLVSGLLVFLLAPEAEGHGTDAAIDAIHRRSGALRARRSR